MTRTRPDATATSPQNGPAAEDQDLLDPIFTDDLLHALAGALPSPENDTDERKARRRAAAVVAIRSFDVQQPVEAMLAAHAVLAHHFTLECYRRAAISSRTAILNTRLLDAAALLSRTFDATLQSMQCGQEDPPVWVGTGETPFP